MNTRHIAFLCAAALFAGIPFATFAETIESGEFIYSLDTKGSPHAVLTEAEATALSVRYVAGDTVTLVSPAGASSTLATAATANGSVSPASSVTVGGLWTLRRSVCGFEEDAATFVFRHSLYGTQGAGTAESPAEILFDDDLDVLVAAGTAGDGYTFTLADTYQPQSDLFAALTVPDGFALAFVSEGVWKLIPSADGLYSTWASFPYGIDCRQTGANRRLQAVDTAPATAYSGDFWRGAAVGSTLTFTSPSGIATVLECTGTGSTPFTFDETGRWTVTLLSVDGSTANATIAVSAGLVIKVF